MAVRSVGLLGGPADDLRTRLGVPLCERQRADFVRGTKWNHAGGGLLGIACTSTLRVQPQGKYQQANVSCHAKRSQNGHDVAARPELLAVQSVFSYFGEELFVACPLSELMFAVTLPSFLPCWRRNRLVNSMPAPYTANRAPME